MSDLVSVEELSELEGDVDALRHDIELLEREVQELEARKGHLRAVIARVGAGSSRTRWLTVTAAVGFPLWIGWTGWVERPLSWPGFAFAAAAIGCGAWALARRATDDRRVHGEIERAGDLCTSVRVRAPVDEPNTVDEAEVGDERDAFSERRRRTAR